MWLCEENELMELASASSYEDKTTASSQYLSTVQLKHGCTATYTYDTLVICPLILVSADKNELTMSTSWAQTYKV
jgi:hypothetical protein